MKDVPKTELQAYLLPHPGASWGEISYFAHSFNGYAHWDSFEKCGETANKILEEYKASGKLPENVTILPCIQSGSFE